MTAERMDRRRGFTLIEVVGALVIFTLGVLMTLNLTDATSERLARAALRSELAARARTHVDSVATENFGSLTTGQQQRTLNIHGRSYMETIDVSSFSPLVMQVRVVFEPTSGTGLWHTVTSYVAGEW